MKKLTSLLVLFVVATGFCQAPNFDLNQFPLSTYLEAENNNSCPKNGTSDSIRRYWKRIYKNCFRSITRAKEQ